MCKQEHKLSEISDAEVLFMGYLAVSDFNGNYSKAHYYAMGMIWLGTVINSVSTPKLS